MNIYVLNIIYYSKRHISNMNIQIIGELKENENIRNDNQMSM